MTTKTLICPYCKGKGKALSSRLSCMVCGAQGIITVAARARQCSACKGAGRQLGHILSCFICRGKGVIETERGVASESSRSIARKMTPQRAKVIRKKRAQCGVARESARQRSLSAAIPEPEKEKSQEIKQELSLWQKVKNLLK